MPNKQLAEEGEPLEDDPELNEQLRNLKPDNPVVSSGFRGLPAIVFGVITNDDQVKDDQATQVIRKAANFIGFGAKLAEEAFQQVG